MIAMALLACGESVARAQDPSLKIPNPPPKPKPPEPLAAFDVVRFASGRPVPNEVIYQEFTDGKLTYEVTAPRIDLARAVEMRQGARFMPLVACPEAPRPPAKPRSKSGQRGAHARLGR